MTVQHTDPATAEDRMTAIRARLDAATDGPWHVTEFDDDHAMSLIAVSTTEDTDDSSEIVAATLVQAPRYVDIADDRWQENAELIAHAPADIAHLLSELEAAQARLDKVARLRYDEVDGRRFPHEHSIDGPECAGCWVDAIDEALGLGEESTAPDAAMDEFEAADEIDRRWE